MELSWYLFSKSRKKLRLRKIRTCGSDRIFLYNKRELHSETEASASFITERIDVTIGALAMLPRLLPIAVLALTACQSANDLPYHGVGPLRITGSDRSKHQYLKRLLPSNPDISALIPLFGTGNRRLIYMPNEVCLVFLNTAFAPIFRQLRRELTPFPGVIRFESIAWRGPTPTATPVLQYLLRRSALIIEHSM